MAHSWKVTWTHPNGSLKEPDEVECDRCGERAMRWGGTFIVALKDVVRALTMRPPVRAADIPQVPSECPGARSGLKERIVQALGGEPSSNDGKQ